MKTKRFTVSMDDETKEKLVKIQDKLTHSGERPSLSSVIRGLIRQWPKAA
jgi:Arc/MetJ-type ribon-helix-helix transcriptional regulator